MNDPKEHLEEYTDGLLSEEQCLQMEAVLARDEALREEMAKVRHFDRMLNNLHDRAAEENAVRRIVSAASQAERWQRRRMWFVRAPIAAALLIAVGLAGYMLAPKAEPTGKPVVQGSPMWKTIEAEWEKYGRRAAQLAAVRREGRVPRLGLSGLEQPPATAQGIVFLAAFDELQAPELDADTRERVQYLVREHFEDLKHAGNGLEGEAHRASATLQLYRKLRRIGGTATAEAFYDVYRVGLPTLGTVQPVPEGALVQVVGERLDAEVADRYLRTYEQTLRRLEGRYGAEQLGVVLNRIAPRDRRFLLWDATQDGIAADAVLAIRAQLYRAAEEAGADRLYVGVH